MSTAVKLDTMPSEDIFNYAQKAMLNNPFENLKIENYKYCLLYTSPSPRDVEESRMPSSA